MITSAIILIDHFFLAIFSMILFTFKWVIILHMPNMETILKMYLKIYLCGYLGR